MTTESSLTLNLAAPWYVITSCAEPSALLAVRELQDHWQQITGQQLLPGAGGTPDKLLELSVEQSGNGDDSFTWQAEPNRICIQGQSARGLLFGVYHFLEALGCRWLAPGDLWTRLPELNEVSLPPVPVIEAPDLAGRCLIIGHYAFMADILDWIEWAARNRYNTIFLHTAPNDIGGGSVPEWAWLNVRDLAMRQMQERGLTLEIGGHGLPSLLPRKLFKQMPTAFRQEDGQRTKHHNFCPSSDKAKHVVQQNARRYFLENPGFDIYHLWADDIPGGGWCSCEQCADLSASDQLLLATNMVAEVLGEIHLQAELSFIAYHDTETAPTQIEPLPNVCMLWAPRMRNYGRATDDEYCPINCPAYPQNLRAQIETFVDAGSVRVFEYYSDAILFKSVLPILTEVMQQDLRFYRDAGVHTVQTLMTGTHPWQTVQLTNWLFARLCWSPDADVDSLVDDFCAAAFGEAGPAMSGYYRALEDAFTLILDQTPDQRGHFSFPSSPLDMLRNPMADMEDPIHAPPETLQRRGDEAQTILALIDEAAGLLRQASALAPSPQLDAETAAFGLMDAWLRFCAHRLRLYAAVATTSPEADAFSYWQAANNAYEQVLDWADETLPSIFALNVRALHMAMWGLRLRRIQGDHFVSAEQRWLHDAKTGVRLALVFGLIFMGYKREKRAVPG